MSLPFIIAAALAKDGNDAAAAGHFPETADKPAEPTSALHGREQVLPTNQNELGGCGQLM
jgi:hypothetical protein